MDGFATRSDTGRSRVAGNTPSSTQTRLLLLVSIHDRRVTVTTRRAPAPFSEEKTPGLLVRRSRRGKRAGG